jgi:hypothetical protein
MQRDRRQALTAVNGILRIRAFRVTWTVDDDADLVYHFDIR